MSLGDQNITSRNGAKWPVMARSKSDIANNAIRIFLQDVGEVALTLIQLRYKQAEWRIQALLDLKDL